MIRFRVVILVRAGRPKEEERPRALIPSPSEEPSVRRCNGPRFIFVELARRPKVPRGAPSALSRNPYIYIPDPTNVTVIPSRRRIGYRVLGEKNRVIRYAQLKRRISV